MKPESGKDQPPTPRLSHRLYHFAGKVRADGAVSALCYATPRAITRRRNNLGFAPSWTTDPAAVNCAKCHRILESREVQPQPGYRQADAGEVPAGGIQVRGAGHTDPQELGEAVAEQLTTQSRRSDPPKGKPAPTSRQRDAAQTPGSEAVLDPPLPAAPRSLI